VAGMLVAVPSRCIALLSVFPTNPARAWPAKRGAYTPSSSYGCRSRPLPYSAVFATFSAVTPKFC
jgi:hypothetical protein